MLFLRDELRRGSEAAVTLERARAVLHNEYMFFSTHFLFFYFPSRPLADGESELEDGAIGSGAEDNPIIAGSYFAALNDGALRRRYRREHKPLKRPGEHAALHPLPPSGVVSVTPHTGFV